MVPQLLPSNLDRALALGQLAGLRRGTKRFAAADIGGLAAAFRIPVIGNVNSPLGRLRDAGLLVRLDGPEPWALTPLGEKRLGEILGALPLERIEAELVDSPGAEVGDTPHRVIPASLAPPRWNDGIRRLLNRYPFETNVFCMTRFPTGLDDDPIAPLIPELRALFHDHGLTLHLASDRQSDDEIFGNVAAHMWACQYGIGLLEDRAGKGLNYNVVIELGAMTITGRRCALLKDVTCPPLPTDFVGHIYKPVDLSDMAGVLHQASEWIAHDLGMTKP